MKLADLDEGRRSEGPTTEARQKMQRLKREVKRQRMKRDIPNSGWLVRDGERIESRRAPAFTKAYQAVFRLKPCRVLGLSPAGTTTGCGVRRRRERDATHRQNLGPRLRVSPRVTGHLRSPSSEGGPPNRP